MKEPYTATLFAIVASGDRTCCRKVVCSLLLFVNGAAVSEAEDCEEELDLDAESWRVMPEAVWPASLKSAGSMAARTSFSEELKPAATGASTAVCTSSILPAPFSSTTPLQICGALTSEGSLSSHAASAGESATYHPPCHKGAQAVTPGRSNVGAEHNRDQPGALLD